MSEYILLTWGFIVLLVSDHPRLYFHLNRMYSTLGSTFSHVVVHVHSCSGIKTHDRSSPHSSRQDKSLSVPKEILEATVILLLNKTASLQPVPC